METEAQDFEGERKRDTHAILGSTHKKKIVLAGPGTGKSFLLSEAIKCKKGEGKSKFRAITFIGKLGDALADELAGLAETSTLHSFARELVVGDKPSWVYFPEMAKLIADDFMMLGVEPSDIESEEYLKRTKYYHAVGDEDVVYYAHKICLKYPEKIPKFDLLLIDEFQDFNGREDSFINLLASENEILIVGDDDQALYGWKGSSPKYIRDKHSGTAAGYEGHTLRWCTRCTSVIVSAFHEIVDKHRDILVGRSEKEYICYLPEKEVDSNLNPKLVFLKSGIAGIANHIQAELKHMLKAQKVKTVLVIGEAQSCKHVLSVIARTLVERGFKNVDYKNDLTKPFDLNQRKIDAYKMLHKNNSSPLGWRIIAEELTAEDLANLLKEHQSAPVDFVNALNSGFKTKHIKIANALHKIINGSPSVKRQVNENVFIETKAEIINSAKNERELLTKQLVIDNHHLPPPLSNLEITVCSILGSKGLGADVVFLVGFDQGKFPVAVDPTDQEVYQMLVALTRAKKRMYLVNTIGSAESSFLESVGSNNFESSAGHLFG